MWKLLISLAIRIYDSEWKIPKVEIAQSETPHRLRKIPSRPQPWTASETFIDSDTIITFRKIEIASPSLKIGTNLHVTRSEIGDKIV